MRLRSYKITLDYGFAPNPFHAVCTLACCKPKVRQYAKIGDLVVGCGVADNGLEGHVVCIMRVAGASTFPEYWDNRRFREKRPYFDGAISWGYGDNIYHHDASGAWIQEKSHHSFENGSPNPKNLLRDTRINRVIWGDDFAYFGHLGRPIPAALRDFGGEDLDPGCREHRANYTPSFVAAVDAWFRSIPERGYLARPGKWQQANVSKLHSQWGA